MNYFESINKEVNNIGINKINLRKNNLNLIINKSSDYSNEVSNNYDYLNNGNSSNVNNDNINNNYMGNGLNHNLNNDNNSNINVNKPINIVIKNNSNSNNQIKNKNEQDSENYISQDITGININENNVGRKHILRDRFLREFAIGNSNLKQNKQNCNVFNNKHVNDIVNNNNIRNIQKISNADSYNNSNSMSNNKNVINKITINNKYKNKQESTESLLNKLKEPSRTSNGLNSNSNNKNGNNIQKQSIRKQSVNNDNNDSHKQVNKNNIIYVRKNNNKHKKIYKDEYNIVKHSLKKYKSFKIDDILGTNDFLVVNNNNSIEPRSYKEIFSMKDKDMWLKAVDEELYNMKRMNAFSIISKVPKDANVISTRWVLKHKKNSEGKIIKYKTRLVSKG